MANITINKQNETETIISFNFDKTVLHYLKRFFTGAKWNAQSKTWSVAATDKTGMMLFLKAVSESHNVEIIEVVEAVEVSATIEEQESIEELESKLEYYQAREMVREAGAIRRQIAERYESFESIDASDNLEMAQCQSCGLEDFAEKMQEVPAAGNDAAWQVLAEQHGMSCEWIEARANRASHHALAGALGGKSTSVAKKLPAALTVS